MKSNCQFYEAQMNQGMESSARAANKTVNGAMSNVMSENNVNYGGNNGNNFGSNMTQAMRNVFLGPDAVPQPYHGFRTLFRRRR